MATRLLDVKGGRGTAIAEDLRRTGDEIDDTKRRLAVAREERRCLEDAMLTERDVVDALERRRSCEVQAVTVPGHAARRLSRRP